MASLLFTITLLPLVQQLDADFHFLPLLMLDLLFDKLHYKLTGRRRKSALNEHLLLLFLYVGIRRKLGPLLFQDSYR